MGNSQEVAPASVSVVVITYNEEKNIRDCLDSLIALDYPSERHEILVVDASKDETPRIVQEYEGVRLIRSSKGFSRQKNAALEAAKFDILAFTDADCIIPREWLGVISQAFQDERVAAVGGNAFPPPRTGRFGKWTACVGHPAGGAIGFDANVRRTEEGVSFVAGCNSAFRKKALLEVNGFDPRFQEGGEDVDVSRRLRERGFFLDYVPELTIYHKARDTLKSYLKWNISVGITKYNLSGPSLLKLVFQPFFPLWPAFLAALWVVFLWKHPFPAIFLFVGLWACFLAALFLGTRPFSLLLKRRKKVGVHLLSCLTVVPVLILLRQISINIGQLKKWV
ncbi:MAG: glycosyltransferase, partial [Candidatus Aminicenantes bacterium]|nr:glycosyltransferase [Candidatus Aminicenantes bacterium]